MKTITTAAAFALALSASLPSLAVADTINTHCQALRVGNTFERACTTTIETPAPVATDPSQARGSATVETVRFDPIEAARILAIPKHDPASIDLCPAPWHMTMRDGCKR